MVNANQEKRLVYFHLNNGNTVVRTMEEKEIIHANTTGRNEGKQERINEFVLLFNEKYSEPQRIEKVPLTRKEERFFCLHGERKICPLNPDDEEEYQNLLRMEEE